jgi:hypothetical protein
MQNKIAFAFIAAAIVLAMAALAQASLGPGNTHTQRASGGLAFQILQPVY